MINFKDRIKSINGITLIALVVTIIILLILAGVTIGIATNGTGLFEKAKLATDEYNNKVQQEETEIAKARNEIDSYISSGRDSFSRSLINKNDTYYNTTKKGYIFEPGTITSNNIINLTETIQNFDYLAFEFDICRGNSANPPYACASTHIFSVEKILDEINNPTEYEDGFTNILVADCGDYTIRLIFDFIDTNTVRIRSCYNTHNSYKGVRITNIRGIKY